MKTDLLPELLRMFFTEWMVQQRNASVHTVKSYRGSFCDLSRPGIAGLLSDLR